MPGVVQTFLIVAAVLLVIAASLALWVFILRVVATLGGWRDLAAVYRVDQLPADVPRLRLRSLRLRRYFSYNNGITLAVDDRGLYLSVLFLLRVGHPTLHIPWEDLVRVEEGGGRFSSFGYERFTAVRVPQVPIDLPRRTANRLRELAGEYWPQ